jgi:MFS family permease
MIGSIFFLGYVSSLLWLPRLADIYGRKGIFFMAMVFSTFSWVVFLFDIDIKVCYFNLFLIGFINSARINVGFVYLMEFIPN